MLRGAVAFGVAATVLTEALGAFHLLRRGPLVIGWLLFLFGLARFSTLRLRFPRLSAAHWILIAVMAAIAAITGFTALLSPPNSSDAMAYHLPRVLYWAQAGSVDFFATPYLNQIMLQPLAEYFMLHTWLLAESDRFTNLVQWLAFAGCGFAVARIAAQLGSGIRGSLLAALFAMTLPNSILQASGAKNDLVLAFWLAAAVSLAMEGAAWWCGAALGLALLTKGTAYLFAPPLLAAALWGKPGWSRFLAAVAVPALLLNAPHYARNVHLSGSPLGFDSAQGDGLFRWQVEGFGVRPAVSNAMRHLSEQLGGRSQKWNDAVHRAVIQAHGWLGIDPNDPRTTWRWATYDPPRNANHETNAHNRWHLLLLVLCAASLAVPGSHRGYYAALVAAFWLFCFYLKWQPFQARMFAPLFVLGAPLAGLCLQRFLPRTWLQAAVCLLLVNNTRPYLFENWIRPLKGPRSLLHTQRNDNYFADMTTWNNRDSYLRAVGQTAQSGCTQVGIDATYLSLEYPFQALLRQRNPQVRFFHVGVTNASTAYGSHTEPCAVLCLDCAGHEEKRATYSALGPPSEIGRFLLFLRPRPQPVQ